MPSFGRKHKKAKARGDRPHSRPAGKARAEASRARRRAAAEIGEIVRKRAEAEAAIAEARKSHERLREAIDILPQGIVFLDAEGRYILWNKKYAEIYNRSSDLFEPGARLRGHASASASSAAIIPKRSAARKSGSPSGSRSCISPARATSRRWPTAASS